MKRQMNYGTVCSGIGAPEVAFDGLGWHGVFCSEIAAFPSAVLKYHFPNVPNFGDFTTITREKIENEGRWPNGGSSTLDVLVGGTPCQSFSLAGLRGGLDTENGNLALEFVRLLARLRPTWFIWENVPGVFSSGGGADFAAILGGFTGRSVCVPVDGWKNAGAIDGIAAAYNVAWRVLDAQYAGVAQRRRRVFVVGHLAELARSLGGGKLRDGGGLPNMAAACLLEREGLRGDSAPSGKAQKEAAGILRGGTARRCVAVVGNGRSVETETCNTLDTGCKDGPVGNQIGIAVVETDRSAYRVDALPCLRASRTDVGGGGEALITSKCVRMLGFGHYVEDENASTILARDAKDATDLVITCNHEAPIIVALQLAQTGGNGCNMSVDSYPTVDTCAGSIGVCYGFHDQASTTPPMNLQEEATPTLDVSKKASVVSRSGSVYRGTVIRRLTPQECCMLQGFPPNWCMIPWRGKSGLGTAWTPQYHGIGNSMAVPVLRWLGMRLDLVQGVLDEIGAAK